MARKTIFLEMAFWDKFLECCPVLCLNKGGNDPATIMENSEKWYDIYKFIGRSSVFVDRPLAELAEKAKTQNDDWLHRLLKRSGDGEMDLEESDGPFPDLESDGEFEYDSHYSSVFLSVEDHRQGASRHGVINICLDNIWEQEEKFKDSGVVVSKSKHFAWSDMNILKENSNAMVIIDNFLLKPGKDEDDEWELSIDLTELLQLLLPQSSYETYFISIFYYDYGGDENSDAMKRESVREWRKNKFYKSIMKFIESQREGLKVELELFPTYEADPKHSKYFHDRLILTNNVWFESPAGFDLSRKKDKGIVAKNSTTTHCLYIGFGSEVAEWLNDAYDRRLSDAKWCLKKYKYNNSKNRLLK